MSSESLTLQQLKDMKEFARQMGAGGATGSMGDVPISSTILSIPGSKITGDIDGNAATATTAEKYALTSGQDASIEDALGLKADQSAMNTALAAKLDAPGTVQVFDEIKQIGQSIFGRHTSAKLGKAVSMNADGTIVAVGAHRNDQQFQDAGKVTVYKQNETTGDWEQMGNDIYGSNANDQAGWSVSLSDDGLTLAVGINQYDTHLHGYTLQDVGMVRVYQYDADGNGGNGQWDQMGSDSDLAAGPEHYNSGYQYFGHAVSLSGDGTVVAVGATNGSQDGYTDYVTVYKWNPPVEGQTLTNGSWTQEGDMLAGLYQYNDSTGFSVSLNHDGSVIAIGASTANANGQDSGMTRVYERTPVGWTQIGHFAGNSSYVEAGTSVSLSDNRPNGGTMRLAIGAPKNTYNASNQGHVRVYEYDSSVHDSYWNKLGHDINGESYYNESGTSVSLSLDGNTLAIGAPYAYNSSGHQTGQTRIYRYISGGWLQMGSDIDGKSGSGRFGAAVSLSADGTRVAIGAYEESQGDQYYYTNRGMMRVYSLSNQKALDITVANAVSLTGAITQSSPTVNNMGGIMINQVLPTYDGSGLNSVKSWRYTYTGEWSGGIEWYWNFLETNPNGTRISLVCQKSDILAANLYLTNQGPFVFSDSRIKKNITDVPDNLALEQVRNLPCRYYEYKDVIERGVGKTIGFIAQEVKEVLPMAVKTMTDFIPDHMRKGEVSWEEVNGTHLMSVSNLDDDVVAGTKMKLYCVTGTAPEINEDGTIKTPGSSDFQEVEKDVVMNIDGKFIMDKQYDGIFIYGRQVNDKLTIDKSKIFALHHSAIQELDKTVEAQKATIAAQQAAIDALMARVAALEGQ